MDVTQTCYLFFDLDGTVINYDGELSMDNYNAMLNAQRLGHKLILNTGRSQGGYQRKDADSARNIPWDGLCFSASDIIYDGELIHEKAVSKKDLDIWLEYCMDHRIDLHYCGRKSIEYWKFSKYRSPIEDADRVKWRKKADKEFKENILTNISVIGNLQGKDIPKSSLNFYQLKTQKTYVDLFAEGCNKGQIILDFCNVMNVSIEQCACFGDSNNDIDMFKVCPIGICMKDSQPDLIKVATYHANTDNGVAEGLSWLLGV